MTKLLLLIVGFWCVLLVSGQDEPPEPEIVDRVVGIEQRCWNYYDGKRAQIPADICPFGDTAKSIAIDGVGVLEGQQVLTIRTETGATYEVTVDAATLVRLGDLWPPQLTPTSD